MRLISLSEARGTFLLSAGVDKDSSEKTVNLAKAAPGVVRAFVGVHPSEAAADPDVRWLRQALAAASGVGEIGLDPKYSDAGRSGHQARAFEAQLTAAEEAGKPVQVHSRGAEEACLDVLSRFRLGPVLMHWFQGESLTGILQDRGYFVSFGPALIYSKRLQRMASEVDTSLVLSETDGPVPFEALGGAEGPHLVPSVVFALAKVWRTGFEEARELVLRNGLRFLGESGKG